MKDDLVVPYLEPSNQVVVGVNVDILIFYS
jgi:hypothetical protein